MLPLRRQILLKGLKSFDLLVMVFSFALATAAAYYRLDLNSFEDFLSMRIKVGNFILFTGFLTVWHIIFSIFRLYYSRRLSTHWEEVIDVIKATSAGSVVIFVASILFRIRLITPIFILIFWIGSSGFTVLGRLVLRYKLQRLRIRGRNLRFMLIVGTNSRAIEFARKIESKPDLGYRLIGFVDDDYAKNGDFKKSGYYLAANFSNFPTFLVNNVVDEVVISLPMKSLYDQASRIVSLCQEQGLIVRFLSNIFNLKLGQSDADESEDDSVITVSNGAMNGLSALIKRGLDFSLSLIILILLSPFFLVIALLIKLTSQGPVFFIQKRLGLNKRRFCLYKFRTMVTGAEKMQAALERFNEVSGPVFKIKNDPRITTIGKFLRKTSIDELPQLLNVLTGDMSLVGPRPLPERDYEGFDEDWHRRRFSVRPGITCLWQVNGRSDIPFERWMQLDIEYISKWSLWLDLKILAKTIPTVLRGSGAA